MSNLQAREPENANEAIGEFYAALPDLSNEAFSLGEKYSNIKLIIIIEETKGLESLLINELIDSFQTFEMNLEDVKCSKTKVMIFVMNIPSYELIYKLYLAFIGCFAQIYRRQTCNVATRRYVTLRRYNEQGTMSQ
ncbi:hypothetical protein J1N35_026804 [Gossypium stocksii]|uniref:Uncharacterized protein n=1 Tax=Gossypium stocksii TaxID=47602 RepID=A0A9D3ZYZ2_9ROSI|nr:hypothetical protein J1N35_026804 [Gossypium stocksii]